MEDPKQKELQDKYMEMQMFEQRIKQVQTQLQSINNQAIEITATIANVNDFETMKSGSEALVPLNNGIFLKATLKENKEFIVNVGSGIAVKKTPEKLKEMLSKQKNELETVQGHLLKALEDLGVQAKNTEEELALLVK